MGATISNFFCVQISSAKIDILCVLQNESYKCLFKLSSPSKSETLNCWNEGLSLGTIHLRRQQVLGGEGGVSPCADGQKVTVYKDQKSPS